MRIRVSLSQFVNSKYQKRNERDKYIPSAFSVNASMADIYVLLSIIAKELSDRFYQKVVGGVLPARGGKSVRYQVVGEKVIKIPGADLEEVSLLFRFVLANKFDTLVPQYETAKEFFWEWVAQSRDPEGLMLKLGVQPNKPKEDLPSGIELLPPLNPEPPLVANDCNQSYSYSIADNKRNSNTIIPINNKQYDPKQNNNLWCVCYGEFYVVRSMHDNVEDAFASKKDTDVIIFNNNIIEEGV